MSGKGWKYGGGGFAGIEGKKYRGGEDGAGTGCGGRVDEGAHVHGE